VSRAVRAVARRAQGYTHQVEVDGHELTVDEPEEHGGANQGPSPTRLMTASLAACTAITIEMYADRKGWEVGDLEVAADFHGAPRGDRPARFEVSIKLPADLSEDQADRIRVIAGKCPVHRTLAGEVEIDDRIERV
jgi:putative redox protein